MAEEFTQDDLDYAASIPMQELTREDAIKRIRDIAEIRETSHLEFVEDGADRSRSMYNNHICRVGAVRELMAIFDIKEEEL